ncbi:hypothetical protein MBLNU457_3397t1 [Dothideomycetes sp. NU457]
MPRRFSLFSQRSRASSHDGSDRKLSMHDLEQATADVEYTALRMSKRWTADMSGLTSSHDHHSTLANRRKSSAVAPNQCAPPSSQSNIRNKRQSSIFVHQTETIVVTSIFDQPVQGYPTSFPGSGNVLEAEFLAMRVYLSKF